VKAPPAKVAPRRVDRGAGDGAAANGSSSLTLQPASDTSRDPVHVSRCVAEFVTALLDLGRSCGDIPVYGSADWAALDPVDPRRFASVVRAAECWRLEGTHEAVRARLADELAVAELFARYRVRAAGLDVRTAIGDWPRVFEVVEARREYRQRWRVPA
jgi:hypothetical protein